mgnify:CR=1 FL=1
MLSRFPRLKVVLWVAATVVPATSGTAQEPGYNADIRPILVEACFSCHGPDSASRRADLRLDMREAAISSGAIAPGKPDDSELMRRILSTDPDEVMPPPEVKRHSRSSSGVCWRTGSAQVRITSSTGPTLLRSKPLLPPFPRTIRTGPGIRWMPL